MQGAATLHFCCIAGCQEIVIMAGSDNVPCHSVKYLVIFKLMPFFLGIQWGAFHSPQIFIALATKESPGMQGCSTWSSGAAAAACCESCPV